ncbi:MAG: hypothetical protein GX793_04185 [Bacteroidales bacterium]|jgi:phage shock protein PspC (stress-responsive transcriptional regulator)|nr:DUF6132 family protein [Bacteroidales bacterium]MCK9498623.1 DUF6132 family protein [Bacteroidales bacterium]MDY0315621.1 DUF6132 family protein [Bacteroidales bacterium]NLB86243.1 hypothetical protein [Bacteroidales bacterium]
MNTFKKKLVFRIVLTVLGGIGGFLYWKYVGCASGTCPIQSKWYFSTLYGLVIAYLISGLFIPSKKKNKVNENNVEK